MNHEESFIQCQIVEYLRTHLIPVYMIKNDGHKTIQQATRDKRMGLSPGIPDLLIFLGNNIVFLEVKTKQGKLSKEQREFFESCKEKGIDCHKVTSVFDVEKIIKDHDKKD